MCYRILVASYTDSLTSLLFDPKVPTLEVTSKIKVGNRPSWLTAHPDDPTLVFTGLEQSDGIIIALKFNEDGNATSSLLQLKGMGPDLQCQESSHPHHIVSIPRHIEFLIPNLGTDMTLGELTIKGEVVYPPGNRLWHTVFHSNVTEGILYTLNKLTSTLTTHHLPLLLAVPTLLSTMWTLWCPSEEPLSNCLATELLLMPTVTRGDLSFLYTSNQNDPSLAGDTLTIFSLKKPKMPKLIEEVYTSLRQLRGAMIIGKDSHWVVLGGTQDGAVKVYERVDRGRSL
ncbi:3-carboxy-cis,cis-mucoante lactonizing enzyme [Lactarius vividus]|nr:3-carboxy-cis,cis-mucoante lactonizing enzyme [Lactarius vividus]